MSNSTRTKEESDMFREVVPQNIELSFVNWAPVIAKLLIKLVLELKGISVELANLVYVTEHK